MNGAFSRLLITAAALLAVSTSFAQQANPDAGFVAPKPKKTRIDTTTVGKPAPYDINGDRKSVV